MKAHLLLIASLWVSGCVGPDIASVPFSPEEASFVNKSGKNSVSGEAFRKRNDGVVVTCAGEEVSLIPVTQYSTQRIAYIYGNTNRGKTASALVSAGKADVQYLAMAKNTVCDSSGKFTFTGIADGDYFVTTAVLWNPTGGIIPEGGFHMARVSVRGGQKVNLVL